MRAALLPVPVLAALLVAAGAVPSRWRSRSRSCSCSCSSSRSRVGWTRMGVSRLAESRRQCRVKVRVRGRGGGRQGCALTALLLTASVVLAAGCWLLMLVFSARRGRGGSCGAQRRCCSLGAARCTLSWRAGRWVGWATAALRLHCDGWLLAWCSLLTARRDNHQWNARHKRSLGFPTTSPLHQSASRRPTPTPMIRG